MDTNKEVKDACCETGTTLAATLPAPVAWLHPKTMEDLRKGKPVTVCGTAGLWPDEIALYAAPVAQSPVGGEREALEYARSVLMVRTVASCTCQTKTNDPRFHEFGCLYKDTMEAINKIDGVLATPPVPVSTGAAPSDLDLWKAGCLTRAQLATWNDNDLRAHAGGIRKTLEYLFSIIDGEKP